MRLQASVFIIAFGIFSTYCQNTSIDYDKIYKYGLDADIQKAMEIVNSYNASEFNEEDRAFISNFKKRFFFKTDESDYLLKRQSKIDSLLSIYQSYWRESMVNAAGSDSLFSEKIFHFLKQEYPRITNDADTIDVYLKRYIKNKGYHTTGFGKTGKLYDLLVWKSQRNTVYNIQNKIYHLDVPVVFMMDFISSGWADYATLGKYYPSGWATNDTLFCVKHKYDLQSEKFLVSFLAHEGQHFEDYANFEDLSSPELEYRAKLVELASAGKTLYDLIEFFIQNSNKDSENGHSVANYKVIKELSETLFNRQFEKDIHEWKKIKPSKINTAAFKKLKENSRNLKRMRFEQID